MLVDGKRAPLISSSTLSSGVNMHACDSWQIACKENFLVLPQKCTSFVAHTNILVVGANYRHKSHDAVVGCFHFCVGETCGLVEVVLPSNFMEAPT